MSDPDATSPTRPADDNRDFRWQALFQRAAEPLFVLDRRRRLVFANRPWEELAGVAWQDVRGLPCRRPRPAAATDSAEDLLAHALTPPPEVEQGAARVRRLLPGRGAARRWWDVEFFPIRLDKGCFLLGRIAAVRRDEPNALPLPERLAALRERHLQRHGLELLDSSVPAVKRLAERVRLAACLSVPVLLLGESGAGKRTVARILHGASPRRERPFVALDCGLPPAYLAEVLFGEAAPANLGTLYLAEPSRLPRELQARLVEWLSRPEAQDDSQPRLLAGTTADLAGETQSGRLLEDLHYVLSTLVLEAPPLRQRLADLPALVERMLGWMNEGAELAAPGLTDEAWAVFREHSWPGNLRELHDTLASARRRNRTGRIDTADLPAKLRLLHRLGPAPAADPPPGHSLDQLLEQSERRAIERALRRARGNKTRAAKLLGIWRPRLIRRMDALGIGDPGSGAKAE
jgi:DNA-binding NtrC family response regulator